MSYILDALKKSDRERSLGSLRKLSTPGVDAARGDRRAVIVLIAVLGVLVAFLVVMGWWYREPLGQLVRGEVPRAGSPESTAPAALQNEPPRVVDSTRDVATATGLAPAPPRADRPNADAGVDATPSGPPAPLSQLPDALRSRLPPLAVSVVSFSGDASRRFVMIDGQIYKEGDQLPAGIRVEKIMRGRIELSMLSERFFINP